MLNQEGNATWIVNIIDPQCAGGLSHSLPRFSSLLVSCPPQDLRERSNM
jgi:hypothetical protein